jgi:hypothetical protein
MIGGSLWSMLQDHACSSLGANHPFGNHKTGNEWLKIVGESECYRGLIGRGVKITSKDRPVATTVAGAANVAMKGITSFGCNRIHPIANLIS